MRANVAIQRLRELEQEAGEPGNLFRDPQRRESWTSRVRGMVARSLGSNHDLVKKLDAVRYVQGMYDMGTPEAAFSRGLQKACGYIDAAIFELEALTGDDDPVDERAFDPELWEHVKAQVADEDWGKVSSQTAIFVENHIRTWSGDPKDGKSGDSLFGKTLYAKVFADDSELRLGSRSGEWEGWRFLGMGFAQAVGNVDRHRIQRRDDSRRYAIGVLGLGSLLLTQLRYQHAEILDEVEGDRN